MTTQNEPPLNAISNEDLQRLVEVAQLITSARDAMSDDIVNRLSWALSEGLILLDRVTRNEGLMRLMQVLEKRESQFLLAAYAEAIDAAGKEIPTLPPAVGGLGCILRVMRDPGVLEGVRLFSLFGKHLSHSMREQHRKGEEAIP